MDTGGGIDKPRTSAASYAGLTDGPGSITPWGIPRGNSGGTALENVTSLPLFKAGAEEQVTVAASSYATTSSSIVIPAAVLARSVSKRLLVTIGLQYYSGTLSACGACPVAFNATNPGGVNIGDPKTMMTQFVAGNADIHFWDLHHDRLDVSRLFAQGWGCVNGSFSAADAAAIEFTADPLAEEMTINIRIGNRNANSGDAFVWWTVELSP